MSSRSARRRDVFDRPANVFVAGFIGSPPMNLLDARSRVAGGRPVARLSDGVEVPLPGRCRGETPEGQEIVLGFRPESFAPRGHSLHEAEQSLTVNRAVTIAEPLGTETILFADLGGKEVQGKMLNPRVVAPGEMLEFTPRPGAAARLRCRERESRCDDIIL